MARQLDSSPSLVRALHSVFECMLSRYNWPAYGATDVRPRYGALSSIGVGRFALNVVYKECV